MNAATRSFDIEGMTCAACVARVERALERVPRVQAASVNLATERARVLADAEVSDASLIAAIHAAGYQAKPHDAATLGAARHVDAPFWPVALALALSLPLVSQMVSMFGGHAMMLPGWLQWLLATPVQFWLGAKFYRAAWAALRAGSGNMEQLVVLGTSAAYFLSLYLLLRDGEAARHQLYFEGSAVVISLVLLGKWLEARAKRRTVAAIESLSSLRPPTAHLIEANGAERDLPLEFVRVGQRVSVRPGERVPVDGVVVEGISHVDESMLTGEAVPIAKRRGATVNAGSVNAEGRLIVDTTAVGGRTMLARIIEMVESAQAAKAPIQRLVDRIAQYFVPAIIVIAALTALGWWLLGEPEQAWRNAITVLVVACPCALGLATPAAMIAGTGVAAKRGVLIRDAAALELAGSVKLVAFDKTGTLTRGRFGVIAVEAVAPLEPTDLLALAASIEAGSEHPLARAIVAAAPPAGDRPAAAQITALPGLGVQARIGAISYHLGNSHWMDQLGVDHTALDAVSRVHAEQGRTLVWLAADSHGTPRLCGLLALADTLRDGAANAVSRLHAMGVKTALLSGDHAAAVERVARELRIDEVHAELLPQDKLTQLARLKRQYGVVAMVGDGINDAPALAAADVGIALGTGTDSAMQAAAITLMRGELDLVADAIDISRKTSAKIRQNLFWAFVYNVIGVPIAALGLANPVLAGAAMALSSVSVLTNALLLQRWRGSGPSAQAAATSASR